MLIGQLMLQNGYMTQDQVDAVLEHQKNCGGLFGMICFEKGFITEKQLVNILVHISKEKDRNGCN